MHADAAYRCTTCGGCYQCQHRQSGELRWCCRDGRAKRARREDPVDQRIALQVQRDGAAAGRRMDGFTGA